MTGYTSATSSSTSASSVAAASSSAASSASESPSSPVAAPTAAGSAGYRNDTPSNATAPRTSDGSSATASGASVISGSRSMYSKIRSNSASDPWISTWTLSSWPSGKKSRLWSVVKATMSPAVGALGSPLAAIVPAIQYTNAGMIEKIVPMIAKNHRPTIAWRIWSRASSKLSSRNRSMDRSWAPNVLPSRIPDTDSVSSVTALMSARRFWVSVLTSRRTLPTR